MKLFLRILFGILLFFLAIPFIYYIIAQNILGDPLWRHDPAELFGSSFHDFTFQMAVLSIILTPLYAIGVAFLIAKKRLRFSNVEFCMAIILIVFLILSFTLDSLIRMKFWFFD